MQRPATHRILAVVVLAATALWVLTGEFARIGSHAEEPPAAASEKPAPVASAPRRVLVATLPVEMHRRLIRVSGVTAADKSVALAARASGIIRELPVEDGATIAAGSPVLVIDGPERLAAVETGRALVAQREAQSRAADALAKSGEGARIAADTARADLAAARAQLRAAEAEVEQLQVVAPFAGIVEDVAVETGAWVQQGAEVAQLIALDPLRAIGELNERDRGEVRPGSEARVRLATGAEAAGRVVHVRSQATGTTRTFRIEVAVPNPGGAIAAGMTAEILIEARPVPVVTVPRSVVTLGTDGAFGVRVVDDSGRVRFQPVTLVDDTARGLAIAGVPEGARIIVAGQDMVTEGEAVTAVTAEPPPPDATPAAAGGGAVPAPGAEPEL